jgi:predicted nucleotidyltransferase
MTQAATALLPVFRSEHQMRLLAEIFCGPRALTGAELARRTGVPQQTVAREVSRLQESGLVTTQQIGSARTIHPNLNLPYSAALRQLLVYAGGIIPVLAEALRNRDGVDEVFIFGSWAKRYRGELGAAPNDVDVAVVSSTLTRFDLASLRVEVEAESGLDVNMVVLDPNSQRLDELREGSIQVLPEAPR